MYWPEKVLQPQFTNVSDKIVIVPDKTFKPNRMLLRTGAYPVVGRLKAASLG